MKNRVISFMLIIVMNTMILGLDYIANAEQNQHEVVCIEKWYIAPGDTLWYIAKVLKPEGMRSDMYIDELKKMNGIDNANNLQSGRIIDVPIYE